MPSIDYVRARESQLHRFLAHRLNMLLVSKSIIGEVYLETHSWARFNVSL
jgi:hypothetical protein